MKKILYMTDFPPTQSGYKTIAMPICAGLHAAGHDVKVIAISNSGEEHWFPYSVIPVLSLNESYAALHNLCLLWNPDVIIVAMDIPLLLEPIRRISSLNIPVKTIAITPMENGPLMSSWAAILEAYNQVFLISELGEREAKAAGVTSARHLKVALSPKVWYPGTPEERKIVRDSLGIGQDKKVILTVADNQERKNLSAGLEIVQKMKRQHPEYDFMYVIVTREKSASGWNLMELAFEMGLQNELIVYERGMDEAKLRLLYIASDVFLLPSKAEGLGLPLIEAMMCGLPCVGTDTGAIHELLKSHGWLVPAALEVRDVWGNSLRSFIDTGYGAEICYDAIVSEVHLEPYVPYTQEDMVQQIEEAINE